MITSSTFRALQGQRVRFINISFTYLGLVLLSGTFLVRLLTFVLSLYSFF